MMKKDRSISYWSLAVILLALIIIAGGIVIFINARNSPGIEISVAPPKAIKGKIYISGEVNNPGLYPVYDDDTLGDLIRAAGGLKNGADASMVQLSVVPTTNGETPQKIDINRAEPWLLEALPGVGEVKAKAIIDYRTRHSFFHSTDELLNIPGISDTVLSGFKHLITVYDE
jgi:competence protein ComEA